MYDQSFLELEEIQGDEKWSFEVLEVKVSNLQRSEEMGACRSFFKWDGWHIDHIIPCAFFDLTKASHQRVCFNWQNLQPLWAKDNLSKRDKFPLSILLVILKYAYEEITV